VDECTPLVAGGAHLRARAGVAVALRGARGARQGLTLVHFSAQLEPCLTQENTLHTLNTPNIPLIRATQPLRATPTPYNALKLS